MAESDNIYDDYTPPTGSGQFFALEDGKSARVRFQSDPYVYQGAFKQPDGTTKLSTRYAWLIYNHEEKKAQVLKQSGTFFSQIKALVKDPDYRNLTEYDVKITRDGTGTDTKYAIIPTKTTLELDKDMLEAIADLDIKKDANEDTIMPLRDFIEAGLKFPNVTRSASGDVILKDLPEDSKVDID